MTQLLDYVVNTWIDSSSATFPRNMWNRFTSPEHRTINGSEGWHSKWNKLCGQNINFHQFGRHLANEISAVELRIQQLINGEPPKPRRRRYREVDIRIRRLMMQLQNHERNLLDYIDGVGQLLHH